MRNCLTLAAKGRGKTSPNPMVGAIVVKDGAVVGRGHHAKAGAPHAEVMALTEAGDLSEGATLYCTMEPCRHFGRTPPCAKAVVEAGIKNIIVATLDPSAKTQGKGAQELRAAGIDVEVGCLEVEARRLNEFFNVFHEEGRPFVTIKWAMTIDGRTGSDSNHSRWISNESSRHYVHQLRALHDAILIGIGTVLADDPMLNVRLEGYTGRQPRRVILDGDLSIPRRARVLRDHSGGPVTIVTTPFAAQEDRDGLTEDGHQVVVLEGRRRLIDMHALMKFLASEQVISVLCEGGRQIETTLLQEDLADKIVAFVAPKVIGGKLLRSPVEELGLLTMDKAVELRSPQWRMFDGDACLEGYLRDL